MVYCFILSRSQCHGQGFGNLSVVDYLQMAQVVLPRVTAG